MSEPFPWAQAMRFGLGTLRLAPGDFWSMTVRELNAAIEAHLGSGDVAPDRNWLDSAMTRFPDRKD